MRLLIILLISALTVPVIAQNDKEMVDKTVTKVELESDMRFIASDELKGRDTGSPEIRIASVYIANRFRSLGVQPGTEDGSYYQKVPFRREAPPASSTLAMGENKFNHGQEMLVMSGNDGSYNGEYVFVEYGLPDDLAEMDLTGKIAVAMLGEGEDNVRAAVGLSAEKIAAAKKAGAIAFVELYKSQQVPWTLIVNYMGRSRIALSAEDFDEDGIPLVYLNDATGELQEQIASAKKLKGSLGIEGRVSEAVEGRNVVGIIEGTDPVLKNEFIALTAHYDHVGVNKSAAPGEDNIYNGARDNGMGTVSILAAAKHFSMYPPKRSVLLVAFTGEEKGLLGSQWFVQNSPVEIGQIIYNLNVDNAGYTDTSIVTVFGMGRTTADPMLVEACSAYGIKPIPDPAPEQNLFDRSDNVNFARMGVPAPTFSGGFTAFDEKINKYYHQVTDGPDTIDYDYLLKYSSSYVLAARMIANSSERPFWVEGDKYEDAGKQLYGISSK